MLGAEVLEGIVLRYGFFYGSGVYNVTDDEPAAARDWIPEVARAGRRPWIDRCNGHLPLSRRPSPEQHHP